MKDTKKKRRMRLPNGIGSVHKIGDGKNRRNPWRARVPDRLEFDEASGKCIQKYITIGYFPTEKEAIAALFEYQKNPYTIEASKATFADVFEMWKAKKYPELSKSAQSVYNVCYDKHSLPLHDMKMRDIRTSHMERIMASVSVKYDAQSKIKQLWSQMFRFAMERDIVQKNYAELFHSGISQKKQNVPPSRLRILQRFGPLSMPAIQLQKLPCSISTPVCVPANCSRQKRRAWI